MMLKKGLFIALLLVIIVIDIYLAYSIIFNKSQDTVKKEVIPINETKKATPEREKIHTPVKKTESKHTEKIEKPKEKKKKHIVKNRKMKEKEIEQLIERIVEEAKMEYHFKKEKKEKKNIIEKLLHFGN